MLSPEKVVKRKERHSVLKSRGGHPHTRPSASSPSTHAIQSKKRFVGKYDKSHRELSVIGLFNSGILSILLCVFGFFFLNRLRDSSFTNQYKHLHDLHSHTHLIQSHALKPTAASKVTQVINTRRWRKDAEFNIYGYSRKADGSPPNALVLLTDDAWWNATLSCLYNVRDEALGNWTDPIIVLGHNIDARRKPGRTLRCLGATYLDITHDKLKDSFWHLHFWKAYILLHDYFRQPVNKFRQVVYIDSDVFTVRQWPALLKRIIWRKQDYVAWREDYRHKSMYKAVINLGKYNDSTRDELKREYPDHPWAKQANVMVFDMLKLPTADALGRDIRRILAKYDKGFWRNDQSLFNLLFYHNSTELGFTAFNGPPEHKLFKPPDEYFPLVHTGHSEAMFQVGKKYHLLHLYYLHRIERICPVRDLFL